MVPVKYEPERWSFISAQAGINEAVPCGSVGQRRMSETPCVNAAAKIVLMNFWPFHHPLP